MERKTRSMFEERFKYRIMDRHFITLHGYLEHWEVYLTPHGKTNHAYRVYINGSRIGEFALDEEARWVDLLFGHTDASENIGEIIEQYSE